MLRLFTSGKIQFKMMVCMPFAWAGRAMQCMMWDFGVDDALLADEGSHPEGLQPEIVQMLCKVTLTCAPVHHVCMFIIN